ncbi:MAG: hypothetical protein NVV82_22695 [Sporocytophaga sp.]|nr:hypothetical protein [Sporocytophaga sp.]
MPIFLFLNTYILTAFNNISVNKKYEIYKGKVVSVKANIDKYRSMALTPPLKNDICQDTPDNKVSENKNSSKNNKANEKANQNAETDATKVIIINGNVKVKEGDTITVNGKQVVVNKDTQIKEGDTVVVNGKTINVSKVETIMESKTEKDKELAGLIKKMIIDFRKEKFDSLNIASENYKGLVKGNSSGSGKGSNGSKQYNKSSTTRSFKISGSDGKSGETNSQIVKSIIYRHLETIAICNKILEDEELNKLVEKFKSSEKIKDLTDEPSQFRQKANSVLVLLIEEYRVKMF